MKDIQKKQDARKKYKMITGREAPRDFDYDKFLAEQEIKAIKGPVQ